jgi:opacity protein-like surface antigen
MSHTDSIHARVAGLATAMACLATPLAAQTRSHPPLHVDPAVEDCSVRFASSLSQSAFRKFAREFGTLPAFRQAAPPATLGRGRVLIGVEALTFRIDDRSPAWNDTFVHPDSDHPLGSTQQFPKIKLRVGVTDDADVGASYTRNLQANYGWLGLDGKYRVLAEEKGAPVSVALRGAYTKTLYVRDMDMHAVTADVSVGRTFWTPLRTYAGVGADGVLASERSEAVTLTSENQVVPHAFAGVELRLGNRMSVGVEYTVAARPSLLVQLAGIAF